MKADKEDWFLFKTTKNFAVICPFHTEKTPSCSINPIEGTFHCYGCGAQGFTGNADSLFTDTKLTDTKD